MAFRNTNDDYDTRSPQAMRERMADQKRQLAARTEYGKLGINLLDQPEPKSRSERLTRRAELRRAMNMLSNSIDTNKPDSMTEGVIAALEYASTEINYISNQMDIDDAGDAGVANLRGKAQGNGYRNSAGKQLVVVGKGERLGDHYKPTGEPTTFGFGEFVQGMALGSKSADVQAALSEGTIGSGGATVPERLALQLIDLVRNKTAAIRAGAKTILLDTAQTSIARLASDPAAAWRLENATITESDPTFDRVTFVARSLAVLVKVSRELLEDSVNLNEALMLAFAGSMAVELDRAALVGSGVAPIPKGVWNTAGVNAVTAAALTHDHLLDGMLALQVDNAADPTGLILNPTNWRTLEGLKDTTGQPLQPPASLAALPRLVTNSMPAN